MIKYFGILQIFFVLILAILVSGQSEGKWIWGRSDIPGSASSNFNNFDKSTSNNFGNFGNNGAFISSPFGSASGSGDKVFVSHSISNRPQSPGSVPVITSLNVQDQTSNDIPISSIRGPQGSQVTQARLIPGAANFISNSLNGNNGGGGSSNFGGGIISTLVQNGPQIGSALVGLLTGRPTNSANNNNNNNNNNSPSNNVNSGNGGGGSSSGSLNNQNCICVPLNQCFLPNRPNGSCQGGNIQCCRGSSGSSGGTRGDFSDSSSSQSSLKTVRELDRERQLETRIGLIEQIIRGGTNIFDDTVDLVLQPFLSKDDQERLATRLKLKKGK